MSKFDRFDPIKNSIRARELLMRAWQRTTGTANLMNKYDITKEANIESYYFSEKFQKRKKAYSINYNTTMLEEYQSEIPLNKNYELYEEKRK